MIKVKAKESFTLGRFDEIKNLKRFGQTKEGWIGKDDEFECEKDLADYLLNKVENPIKRAVVQVIEVKKEAAKEEVKEEKKKVVKKTTKKKEK